MKVELFIAGENGTEIYIPAVEDGIEWSTERWGVPGKLTFKILADDILNFSEGAAVQLRVDGAKVFFGFVFTQKRDKENRISVTAYDQLRYLKNKDTYMYENQTASEVIRMIVGDFALNAGEIEDTGYVIAERSEWDTSLFDIIQNALDITLVNTRQMFVLYDDFGSLTLKNIANMYVQNDNGTYLMIDEDTGRNFEYTSSIDSNTYNKIKLVYDNQESGKRDVYIMQDGSNMNQWGILQYYDTLSEGENGEAKAEALLSLYNKRTRNLRITNAFGDIRVRAGSLLVVNLNLGDMKVENFMLVEKVKHTFKNEEHFMDLTLRGGEFVA
ncbi:MAG: hydrolase [Lachnospiraceae bacterium]|nr:hydrolase [Lachnospiraceae bacterium]